MDPWMELHWRDVHARLIIYIADQLQSQLPEPLVARANVMVDNPAPLRERLPRIAIPLRPGDRDVALDLQQVVDDAYERGRYDRTDYRRPLKPPLSPEDAAWASELLAKAGRL